MTFYFLHSTPGEDERRSKADNSSTVHLNPSADNYISIPRKQFSEIIWGVYENLKLWKNSYKFWLFPVGVNSKKECFCYSKEDYLQKACDSRIAVHKCILGSYFFTKYFIGSGLHTSRDQNLLLWLRDLSPASWLSQQFPVTLWSSCQNEHPSIRDAIR